MDRARKTEIVDEIIWKTLKQIRDDYEGEILMQSDSNYNTGRIIIKVKN